MSALARISDFPDWPARMTAPIAAAYMGISQTSFLTRYSDVAVKEGGNTLWARRQLDRIIARQFALAQPSSAPIEEDTTWDDLR